MMRHKKTDCGCGKKAKCITKSALKGWVKSELKRLDCGCGCKGAKGFAKKYSGGGVLNDCPPGYRNDGLTCLEECKPGEVDDGLFCRDTNPPGPGWVNDGLTFRDTNAPGPGWVNDGLTFRNTNPPGPGWINDGLTFRNTNPPGPEWINDGLTFRKPITLHRDDCPAGWNTDELTCTKPIVTYRDDCPPGFRTDELTCFKDLSCRTWSDAIYWDSGCNWPFGCAKGGDVHTDCSGPEVISRNPRTEGGEIISRNPWSDGGEVVSQEVRNQEVRNQEIRPHPTRGKDVKGRVNFDELGKELEVGLTQLFSEDGVLARSFDPSKNGINDAFRKFGDDMNAVLNEVNNHIKEGFNKMGDDAKKAFEQLAKNAERDFKKFGDDFVAKMKDPDFWVEFIGIAAMVAGVAVSILVTVGTLGIGAPAAAGIMAAAAMVGPAARIIAKAAKHEPIDGLDIAEIGVAAVTAFIPGMGPMAQVAMKVATTAASVAISAVRVGQALDLIPPTCVGFCPPPEPANSGVDQGPIVPDPEGNNTPPAPGQLSDKEILALQPANQITLWRKKPAPKHRNPDYIDPDDWVAQYRVQNYGSNPTPPGEPLESAEDKRIREATNIGKPETKPIIPGEIINENKDVNLVTEETVGDLDLGIDEDDLDLGISPDELDLGISPDDLDLGISPDELDTEPLTEDLDLGISPDELDLGISPEDLDLGISPDELVGGAKPNRSLTLYYADWCPHCKTLIPILKKLKFPGVVIRMLEEQENNEFEVKGYPTIVYRSGSTMEMYNGPRTKSGIVSYLKNKL